MATKNLLDKIVAEVTSKSADTKPATTTATTTKKDQTKAPAADAPASAMATYLDNTDIEIPQLGDVVTGTVIDLSGGTLLVDLDPIGTGIVIGREAKSGLAEDDKVGPGSEITATVVDLETEEGYIELSIREASYERAWEDLEQKLENKETIATRILDANKGGLMVEVNGMTGFLPVSQLSSKNYPRVEDGDKNKILEILKQLIGQELGVRILDIDRPTEKLIVSEKEAYSEEEKKSIATLSVGETISGEVSGVVDFGAFVKFLPKDAATDDDDARLEGLVHISELAWQLIDNPREIVKVGDKVEAKIIGIDNTRISLSIKALQKDPWTDITSKYNVGDTYTGKVDKISHFGAFVYLDQDIHGLAHVSEFQEAYPGKKLDTMIEEGQEYEWKVLSIEPKEHRMGLLLMDKNITPKEKAAKEPSATEDKAE